MPWMNKLQKILSITSQWYYYLKPRFCPTHLVCQNKDSLFQKAEVKFRGIFPSNKSRNRLSTCEETWFPKAKNPLTNNFSCL